MKCFVVNFKKCLSYTFNFLGYTPFKEKGNNNLNYSIGINYFTSLIKKDKKINISSNAIDLLEKLLNKDAHKRLGSGENAIENIKNHSFFKGVNWEKIYNKQIKPEFIPILKNEEDLKYFDKIFTDENPNNSMKDNIFENSSSNKYEDFTFVKSFIKD